MTAEQEQAIRKDERAKVVEEILEIIRGHSIESVGGPIENALIGWDCESWLYCGSIFDRVPYDSL